MSIVIAVVVLVFFLLINKKHLEFSKNTSSNHRLRECVRRVNLKQLKDGSVY